jgi:hypothetical protein
MLPFAPAAAQFLACALTLPGAAQAQLFSEDFESGGVGWTATGKPEVLWHVAENGECGAVTRMAAYNRFPNACDYKTGGANTGAFLSPVFTLSGPHSFVVQYDYLQETDEGGLCVEIVNEADGESANVIGCTCCSNPYNAAEIARASAAVPNLYYWRGKKVRLRFDFKADSDGNTTMGVMVDNVRVFASGPPEELFFEDFESESPAWTATTEGVFYAGPPLWHLADAGECGAPTRMGAYNLAPAACDYHTPNLPNAGKWKSPTFTLSGAPPYVIEFESRKDMNAKGDEALLLLVDPLLEVSSGGGPFANSSKEVEVLSVTVSPPGFWDLWSGKHAHIEFAVNADPLGNLGSGWMVDNVRVTNSGSLPAERPPTGAESEPGPAQQKEKDEDRHEDGDKDEGGRSSFVLDGWSGYPTLGRSFTQRDLWVDFSSVDSGTFPRTIALLGARLKSW